jgi:tetratricopeptide (TPR) repeat protein
MEEREKAPESSQARSWLREAVEAARQAAVLKPDNPDAYLIQGASLLLLGEPAQAIEPLRCGVRGRPDGFKQQYYLGMALLDVASWYHPMAYQEAGNHLKNASRLDPTNPLPDKALQRLPLAKR